MPQELQGRLSSRSRKRQRNKNKTSLKTLERGFSELEQENARLKKEIEKMEEKK